MDLFLTDMQLSWIIVMLLSAVLTLVILTAPIHCRGSIGEQVMECYISPSVLNENITEVAMVTK